MFSVPETATVIGGGGHEEDRSVVIVLGKGLAGQSLPSTTYRKTVVYQTGPRHILDVHILRSDLSYLAFFSNHSSHCSFVQLELMLFSIVPLKRTVGVT